MKKIIIILLITAGISFAQSRTYSIDEALSRGLGQSEEIEIARSKAAAAEAAVTEARARFLPHLSLSAGYTRLSDIPDFTVSIPAAPRPVTIQQAILDNYKAEATVTQPIFTGFRLLSLKKAAGYNKKAAEEELSLEKNQKALEVHEAFWNLYRARSVNALVEKNLEALNAHLEDTRNYMEQGLATRNSLLKLEVGLSDAEYRKIEADNALKLARAAFNKAIGAEISSETDILVDTSAINIPGYDFNSLKQEALENREELAVLNYRIKAGEEGVDAAQADWFPSVYAFGNFTYARPNQRIMPLQDEFTDTWQAGVQLTWNLWDWDETGAKKEQAEQKVVQAKYSRDMLLENIELQVYKYFLEYRAAEEKLESAAKALASATENLRVTKNLYGQQTATATELTDAETALLKAGTDRETAYAGLQTAKARLEKAAGRKIY